MRTLAIALFAALACSQAGQARDIDLDARAALALALAGHQDTPAVKPAVCPCSQSGVCTCSPGDDCGCLAAGGYRWVATSNANQTALYRGSVQLGNWWHAEKEFRRLIDRPGEPDVWTCEPCPVASPPVKPVTRPVVPASVPLYRPQMLAPQSFGGFRGGRSISGGC